MGTHFLPFWNRLVVGALRTIAVAALVSWGASALATTPSSADAAVRLVLGERIRQHNPDAKIAEEVLPPALVRVIVREHLDPKLLATARSLSGAEFSFVPAGQTTPVRVNLLVLTYGAERLALRASKNKVCTDGYFRNTKVLTPYSCSQVSDQLVIVFTENGASAGAINVVKTLRQHLPSQAVTPQPTKN